MKLLCIDGNSIMNRAYYGIKVLTNSKGISTNAITGFMNIYLKEIAEVKPDCVAVAFDLRSPTFRHLANSAYKANRKGMPDDLAQQMPLIRKLLKLLGIKTVECEGFEADDILGTLSRAAADSGNECFILTGDRDSFQLINDKVTVRLAGTKETKIYTPQRIRDEYGVEPLQMIEVKALMGDTSDNISGVRGIGEKTALSLIQQTGSVDGLYDSIDELTLTKSVRSKLECGRQDALDSRFLATIRLDVPIEKSMEAYKLQRPDSEAAREMLTELEMLRLMERLGLSDTKMANTDQETKVKLKDLPKYELDLTLNDEVILTMTEGKKAAFIFDGASIQVFFEDKLYKLAQGDWDFDGVVLRFFESGCEKITFEGKRAHKFAFDNDTHLNGLTFCCDLAGYLLNSQAGEYTVENLSLTYKVIYRADLEEYADVAPLERVRLCDTVSVYYPDLGVQATAKVIKVVWDALTDRYDSIELGDAKTSFADVLQAETNEKLAEVPNISMMDKAIQHATDLITGGMGGHIVFLYDADGKPTDMLVMDTEDVNTAVHVLRINVNGIGFSSTGVSGTYASAWTLDGRFVADFITAGTMSANRIQGGTLSLGGAEDGNGVMVVYDASGDEIGRWSKDGINITKGSFSTTVSYHVAGQGIQSATLKYDEGRLFFIGGTSYRASIGLNPLLTPIEPGHQYGEDYCSSNYC